MIVLLVIGVFFFVTSFPIMADNFGTGLLGLVLGVILIAVWLFILKRKKPQFFQLIAKKDFLSALKSLSRKYDAYADINRQIVQREAERAHVNELPDLTPVACDGHNRKYHYKDVNIRVRWEYSGHYGKSCQSIGMKRGDVLQLLPPKEKDQEPGAVAVVWKGIEIGYMKANRMQDMVHSWQAAKLPVLATVARVGGEEQLYIEISFYGSPKTH